MEWADEQGGRWTTGEAPVAAGGQAEVYRTVDGRHAVKAARPGQEEHLRREAQALVELVAEHQGLDDSLVVPRAHGGWPRPFLVMDWYPWDATRWLGARSRSLVQRLSLAESCCRAVVALHWADGERVRNMTWRFEGGGEQVGRVVHRDIKPGNFLLREGPVGLEARLCDFGAVRTAQARTVTMATQIYTEGFAPIEQTLPRRVVPEVSWDVFALAGTVFWILTGALPNGCLAAASALTIEGHQLQALHRQALARPGASSLQVQRDELAGRTLETLVDYSRLRPFTAEDEQELVGLLGRQAGGLVRDLRRALAPRPRERMTDARDLLQRVVAIREEVEEEGGEEQTSVAASAPSLETVTPVRPPVPSHNLAGRGPVLEATGPRGLPGPETVSPMGEVPARRSTEPTVRRSASASQVRLLALGGVGVVGLTGLAGLGIVGVRWMEWGQPDGLAVGDLDNEGPATPIPMVTAASADNAIPMVRINPGSFTMGCTPGQGGECSDDESPVSVTLTRAFWMGETEVTQAQWEAVMGENPSRSGRMVFRADKDGDHDEGACGAYEGVSLVKASYPVMCVSWCDAVAFANALSAVEGLPVAYSVPSGFKAGMTYEQCKSKAVEVRWNESATGYRLPTEAEWEYAGRADLHGLFAGAESEDALCGVGNVADATAKSKWSGWTTTSCNDGEVGLAPVASYAANAWGLYDMSGNVLEWTWDVYGEHYVGGTDPSGANGGDFRVYRGGSWNGSADLARLAYRVRDYPSRRSVVLGLRLARSIP